MRPSASLSILTLALLAACNGPAGGDSDTDPPVTWPDAVADYEFDRGSYIHTVQIPDPTTQPCCRDFGENSRDFIEDGTDNPDNALGVLDQQLRVASKDKASFEGSLQNTIEAGSWTTLLDFRNNGDLAYLTGRFDGVLGAEKPVEALKAAYDRAKAGDGTFLLEPSYFEDGEAKPLYFFETVELSNGQLTATNGRLDLPMPLLLTRINVPLQRVNMSATLEKDGAGYKVNGARVSGYIAVDDWFKGYNDVVADQCACAELSQPVYRKQGGEWQNNCLTAVQGTCTGTAATACGIVVIDDPAKGGLCGTLFDGILAAADIDFDEDPASYEGLSVGLLMGGAPATAVGEWTGETE